MSAFENFFKNFETIPDFYAINHINDSMFKEAVYL